MLERMVGFAFFCCPLYCPSRPMYLFSLRVFFFLVTLLSLRIHLTWTIFLILGKQNDLDLHIISYLSNHGWGTTSKLRYQSMSYVCFSLDPKLLGRAWPSLLTCICSIMENIFLLISYIKATSRIWECPWKPQTLFMSWPT